MFSIIIGAAVGACLGSFAYATYLRKTKAPGHEKMESLLEPSRCPACGVKIPWSDNIPIISYLILGGRCRNCHTEYSVDYFFAEVAGLILGVTYVLF